MDIERNYQLTDARLYSVGKPYCALEVATPFRLVCAYRFEALHCTFLQDGQVYLWYYRIYFWLFILFSNRSLLMAEGEMSACALRYYPKMCLKVTQKESRINLSQRINWINLP
jgi:hypothetical protein